MKTIEKASKGTEEKSKKQNREKTDEQSEALGKEDTDQELSINERQLIQNKIEENWDLGFLIGTPGLENVQIKVKIFLSYDGSLSQEAIIESFTCSTVSSSICDALVRGVTSAISKSSPISGLPIDRYESWKEISFVFTPQPI